ncbi:MAG TPA: hypothetical protein VGG79_13545 [Roseiarcus sp.]
MNASGEARVDHTVHVDLDPGLRAEIDVAAGDDREFTVPLIGGGLGRMDGEAAPTRRGGIGSR